MIFMLIDRYTGLKDETPKPRQALAINATFATCEFKTDPWDHRLYDCGYITTGRDGKCTLIQSYYYHDWLVNKASEDIEPAEEFYLTVRSTATHPWMEYAEDGKLRFIRREKSIYLDRGDDNEPLLVEVLPFEGELKCHS